MDSDKNAAAPKTCFVVMPVTTPQEYEDNLQDADHFKHVLDYLFTPALKIAGFTVLPPVASGATMIQADIIAKLERADLVLCDLSSLNPNVFFELGVRTSLDRAVALVRDERTPKIPFDVSGINTYMYNSSTAPWVLDTEVPNLVDYIQNVMLRSATGNELWKYFGLTKPGLPAEPKGDSAEDRIEAKLDLFRNEMVALVSSAASQRVVAERLNRASAADAPLGGYAGTGDTLRAALDRVRAMLGRDLRRVTPASDGVLVVELNRPFTPEQKSQVVSAAEPSGISVVFIEP
jgi:hypothetical protein